MDITISLTDTEFSALSRVCLDPKEWIENAAKTRANIAIEEIVSEQVRTMLADPSVKTIPANVDKLVASAPEPVAPEVTALEAAPADEIAAL